MFKDLISFCEDIEKLRNELIEKGFVNDGNDPVFPLENKTPTQSNNSSSTVTIVRCLSDDEVKLLESFDSLMVLGTKDEVDADSGKTEKYESAYNREPVFFVESETGKKITYIPPYWHGGFA